MIKEMSLIVEESPVKAGGRARVNSKTLKNMNLGEGELVVLSSDRKDILVTIYCDDLMSRDNIKIRKNDARKLGVKDSDKIKIKEHQSLLTKLL